MVCHAEWNQTRHPRHLHGKEIDQSTSHRGGHQMTTNLLMLHTSDLEGSVLEIGNSLEIHG